MKNSRIYHLEFARDIETVVWEYSKLSEHERHKLNQISFESSFDYIDKFQNYNFILITTQEQINKYTTILHNNLIPNFLLDWTDKILKDKIKLEKIEDVLDKPNRILWQRFKTKIEDWILINQELDNVLDLINEKGIDNLRQIDLKFLESYGKKDDSHLLR